MKFLQIRNVLTYFALVIQSGLRLTPQKYEFNQSSATMKKFFHNLTTCNPNGSWNNTQMVAVVILIVAIVLLVGRMECIDHAMYGY